MAACAAPAPIPATTQPALTMAATPYADGMRKAGIRTVQVFEGSPRVRMSTRFGDVYFRYPSGLAPTAFAVYVDPQTIEVDSDTYNASNSVSYEAAIRAVLPACIERARANNKWAMEERIESESK
jgi:hypothetical protein